MISSAEEGKTSPVKLDGIKPCVDFGAILCALVPPMSMQAESEKGEKGMIVSPGTKVSVEYTLRREDNAVIDANVGSEPLTYVHGFQQIIPGLEKALEGMKIGERKQITVIPEEGYGVISQEAFIEVKKEQVPQDALNALRVDAYVRGRDEGGNVFHARVAEIKDQTVLLDFNHPLAGETLFFEVKVLDIQEAPTD